MSKPVLVIAGLGRCGSTMVMHMLAAGGQPCEGTPPAFEVEEAISIDRSWFNSLRGKAVKVLNPQHVGIPDDVPRRTIYLERRVEEQAKSICKMLSLGGGAPVPSSRYRRLMQNSLIRDNKTARALMRQPTGSNCTSQLLVMQFEEILAHPRESARKLAMMAMVDTFDIGAAAAVVQQRSPFCATDMAIELQLTAAAAATQEQTP